MFLVKLPPSSNRKGYSKKNIMHQPREIEFNHLALEITTSKIPISFTVQPLQCYSEKIFIPAIYCQSCTIPFRWNYPPFVLPRFEFVFLECRVSIHGKCCRYNPARQLYQPVGVNSTWQPLLVVCCNSKQPGVLQNHRPLFLHTPGFLFGR